MKGTSTDLAVQNVVAPWWHIAELVGYLKMSDKDSSVQTSRNDLLGMPNVELWGHPNFGRWAYREISSERLYLFYAASRIDVANEECFSLHLMDATFLFVRPKVLH